EHPVLGAVHDVAAGAVRDTSADTGVTATTEAHPGELVLRAPDTRMRPERGHAPFVGSPSDGIHRRRPVLPAHHGAATVHDTDLPEGGVAGEERRVAAAANEALDRVAHPPGPVLVVPDAQVEPIWIEHIGTRVQVQAGEEVETNAPRLGPGD